MAREEAAPRATPAADRATPRLAARGAARWLPAALGVVVLLGLPILLAQANLPHWIHILIMISIYATLAQAWNILGGFAGQVSLGNAVFFGIGAYTSTLMMVKLGLSPWLGIPVGMLLAALLSVAIGIPVFRLGGHYFAIATIAVGEIVQTVFINWRDVGGAAGLQHPILPEALVNFQFHSSKLPYYYIGLLMCALAFFVAWRVEHSRLGFYFRAIKGDPLAARTLGIDIGRYKLIALAVSAVLSAMAGSFYAQYIGFIDPESVLPLSLSILICLVAVTGGVNSLWGPLLGACVLIPLSESTRVYLANLGGGGRAIDLMIYGLLIVVLAVFQPAGLMGILRSRRRPERRPNAEPNAVVR